MRKRSSYRPKGVRLDVMAYVRESMTPVAKHSDYLLTLKIKNHAAMAALTRGGAIRKDIDLLISMGNVCEALYRMGFGQEYGGVVRGGMDALFNVGQRGALTNRFVLRAEEMQALNLLMELHDAQMDVITIKDMERAIDLVHKEFVNNKMRVIVKRKEPV